MRDERVLMEVLAAAYPGGVEVKPGRLRRNWIVRTARPVEESVGLDELSKRLTDTVAKTICESFHVDASVMADHLLR